MKSKTGDSPKAQSPDEVAAYVKLAPSGVRTHSRPTEANGWYSAPNYNDMDDLGDDQAAIRMKYLTFQVGILEEAAEFESRNLERGSLLVTILKCKAERDALGEHLRRRIVQGDLREAQDLTQQHVRNWGDRQAGTDRNQERTPAFEARTDKHKTQKKCKPVQPVRASTLGWNGIERRQSVSSLIAVTPRANLSQKGRRPRTIEISLKF